MPHSRQYPLWSVNRAIVAFEAMELARRADQGKASRSRDRQPSRKQPARLPLRRVAIALALMLATVGVAAARWAA